MHGFKLAIDELGKCHACTAVDGSCTIKLPGKQKILGSNPGGAA